MNYFLVNFITNTTTMKMLIRNSFYFLVLLALVNCKNSKDKSLVANSELADNKIMYDNALEVPVGKLGVLIYVDTLSVYDHTKAEISNDSLEKELLGIENDLSLDHLIKQTAERILKKNKYNYTLIESNAKMNQFMERFAYDKEKTMKGFKELGLDKNFDDILLVQVSSGLTYDQYQQNKLTGKTSIYIDIIDPKASQIKYSELIFGNRYLNRKDFKSNHEFILNTMRESVVETVNIIDKKY